jgi:hypothetical protein
LPIGGRNEALDETVGSAAINPAGQRFLVSAQISAQDIGGDWR